MADPIDLESCLAAVQKRCTTVSPFHAGNIDLVALSTEVQALTRSVALARRSLAALAVDDIIRRHVPAANAELCAIVTHTAAATDTILDACERLEQDVEHSPCQGLVLDAARQIYEACSFQDITGQRVDNIVQTLSVVEARLRAILLIVGQTSDTDAAERDTQTLLNGPQRPFAAMDQNAVDALMGESH